MSADGQQPNASREIAGAIQAAPVSNEVDTNVPQPRQPSNLQGLLRFAMDATKSEDAPGQSTFGVLDEERKKFLETALRSMTVDVIETLYKSIQILQKSDTLKLSRKDISEYMDAFESIVEHVDMIDTAIDFHKIGGFTVFPPCLNCVHPQIRAAACNLLAELCQNNPYCQKVVVDSDLMEQLINLLVKDGDDQVRIKALYAISCNIRGNAQARAMFMRHDGLNLIMDCVKSKNERLREKSAFLLTHLIALEPPIRDDLNDFIPVLIGLLSEDWKQSHDQLLNVLQVMVLDNSPALAICAKEEYGLEPILKKHITSFMGNPDMVDERQKCEQLLQEIVFVEPDPVEAER